MAKFMFASRHVVWFDSWPKMLMSAFALPPLPLPLLCGGFDELQRLHEHAAGAAAHGSNTRPLYGRASSTQHLHDGSRRIELATPYFPSALANCERKYSYTQA